MRYMRTMRVKNQMNIAVLKREKKFLFKTRFVLHKNPRRINNWIKNKRGIILKYAARVE